MKRLMLKNLLERSHPHLSEVSTMFFQIFPPKTTPTAGFEVMLFRHHRADSKEVTHPGHLAISRPPWFVFWWYWGGRFFFSNQKILVKGGGD